MRALAKFLLFVAVLLVAGERGARVEERRASVLQTPPTDVSNQGVCQTDALPGPVSEETAIARLLALPVAERLDATSALMTALVDRPGEAVRVAERLCHDDPIFVREHGNTLITVLSAAGEHARAVEFAALGGPERGEWLARAFCAWSAHAPRAAAEAALAFDGDDATTFAFGAWASRDPLALARFAAQSPAAQAAAGEALLGELNRSESFSR